MDTAEQQSKSNTSPKRRAKPTRQPAPPNLCPNLTTPALKVARKPIPKYPNPDIVIEVAQIIPNPLTNSWHTIMGLCGNVDLCWLDAEAEICSNMECGSRCEEQLNPVAWLVPTRGVQITVQVTESEIWKSYGGGRTYSTNAKRMLRLLTSYFGEQLVVRRNTQATRLMRSFTLSQNVFGINNFGVKLSHDDLH